MNNPSPKEKAKQLINKYNLVVLDTSLGGSNQRVKQCALIAVDEVLKSHLYDEEENHYYIEVKKEIERL